MTILVLSPEQHRDLRWTRPTSHLHAVSTAVTPVGFIELPDLVAEMPAAFVDQGGEVHLVAVMSPVPGRNLFVGPSGEWLGSYIPIAVRTFPFVLGRIENDHNVTLAFDEGSGCLSTDVQSGERFFEADGVPSAIVKNVFDVLAQTERSRAASSVAATALRDAGVLVPWSIKLNFGDREVENTGLLRVDEPALNALPAESFMELRERGVLPLAYLQLMSIRNLRVFEKLNALHARLQERLAAQVQAVPAEAAFSMEEFLAQHGNHSLNFD